MRITLDWLKSEHADVEHVALFEATWGDAVDLTRENLRLAASLGFEMGWLAARLLTGDDLEACVGPHRERFRAATAGAEATRRQALLAACERFQEATGAEHAAYTAHQAAAKAKHKQSPGDQWEADEWAAYMVEVQPRLSQHQRAVAPALADVRRAESAAFQAFQAATGRVKCVSFTASRAESEAFPVFQAATRPALDDYDATMRAIRSAAVSTADALADVLGLE